MARGGNRARGSSVGVPNLYRDASGTIFYRKMVKGELVRISTGTRSVEEAATWKREREGQRLGGGVDPWKQPLAPLKKRWLGELACGQERRDMLERQIDTATELLSLDLTGDLRDRPAIKQRLRALGMKKKTEAAAVQAPLKQFSAWLAAEDVLPADPLVAWKRLDTSREPKRPRRGTETDEFALALAAGAWFDLVRGSARATRPIFVTLLVAAPRVGAFVALDVDGLDHQERRLLLGADEGNKLKGTATLDEATYAEVVAYVERRKAGPLFLSPEGERLRQEKLLRAWRERMDLALVIDLWPAEVPKVIEDAWAVARYLTRGRAPTPGGNPKRLTDDTRRARRVREQRIAGIAETIAERFKARRVGIDVHAFRMTHQSWAEAQEDPVVLPAAIDKQLGHSNKGGAALEAFFASRIGRSHYRDLNLASFDARRSAEAVRRALDRAVVALQASDYRGWEGLSEAARRQGVVSECVSSSGAIEAAPEGEGPEASQLPALRSMEMTGLEPVAYTLRTYRSPS